MKKIVLNASFFLIGLILCQNINAYNLRQISNHDGLSNSAILSICQDKDGFLWFGSCDGLNMFNGLSIRVYKPTDEKNNLSGNLIENVLETEDGILWVYTNYGLNRLDKRTKKIDSFNQFKGRYLIQKDKNNHIFIIKEDDCIYYYKKETKTFEKIILRGLKYNDILNFVITSDNKLQVFTKDQSNPAYVIKESREGDIKLEKEKLFSHNENLLYCFYERGVSDVVYFIDNTYTLYEYHFADKKKYYVRNLKEIIQKNGEISSVIKHHNDYFIGFKTNGLLRLKYVSDKLDNYQPEDIGIKSGIFCLINDRYQDLVWIGTDGQGVYMYSNDMYSIRSAVFNTFTANIEKPVRALFLDKEKTLWIGTKGDGIVKIKNYDFNQAPSKFSLEYSNTGNSALTDNSVYAFAKSKKNILWIGCEEGLSYYSYSDRSIKRVPLIANGEPVKYIHSICELNDSTLWLATVGTGIVKVSVAGTQNAPVFKNASRVTIRDGRDSQNYFFTIYQENDSILWFGNRGYGAYSLNTNQHKLDTLVPDKGINQTLNDIFSIIKDSNNAFWFGTSFGLVKHVSGRSDKIFNERNGFSNNTIHGILADARNNLWLSTNRGIIKFNIEQDNFQTYSNLNGLQIIEYSDGAYFKDEESDILFFGGINGFVAISETGMAQPEYFPRIQFDNLMIFGQEKNIFDFLQSNGENETLELNYNQNFFSISFTALDYVNGNNYTYYYKLDDLSKQWIDNGTSNNISFTSLSPGEYTLFIKYMNRLTGKESPVYSITIKITPPWYLSPLAYVLYATMVISVIYLLIRAAIIKDKKKKYKAMMKIKQRHQEEVHESKLRFFTNIAHEFCTPLTLIYGPCNRILSHAGSDSFVRKYTQLIQRNAERLNDLIQELIEFRRIETGNKSPQIEPLSITDIAHDISDSFNDLAESKNIQFSKDIEDSLVWNSDRGFIYTILSNLVSNAFKYTAINGFIQVEVYQENDELLMIISNTGKGIKAENITRIFDRYSILDDFENREGKREFSRNGLGLAISYSMVKLLDGTIEVNSILDERTDFIVKLPQKEVSDVLIDKNQALLEITIRKDYEPMMELPKYAFDKLKPTIFIIDDDVEILWFISEIFADEYNVIPIDKPLLVDEMLTQIHPNIIICDVMMPGRDGISLTKEIKSDKKTAHIPMILVSAKHTIEEQIEGLSSGAEMYLAKPFNADYLRTSVKHLISRKETLKDYFSSPLSAFDLSEGKMTHKENTKFIQDIYNIIEKNIMNNKLSAQFIAAELNMSPRHLYRRLSEVESDSPADMIRESRLYIARNLLLNTKMTIDEIIYKSGFSNRATFFRQFAQKYGCTPKEYRDREMYDV